MLEGAQEKHKDGGWGELLGHACMCHTRWLSLLPAYGLSLMRRDLGCPLKRVTIQLGCLLLGPSARVGAPCPLGPGLNPQHSHCAPLPQFPPTERQGGGAS